MPISTSISGLQGMPPPRKRPGPERKPMARSDYKLPQAVTHVKRTYSRRRKIEVLLFLENHRIPLRQDLSDLCAAKVIGDSPVQAGFRRPFLREAAAYFGIQSWGTVQSWWSSRHTIYGDRIPRYRPKWPELEVRLYSEFCAAREARRLVQHTWFRRRATAIFADLYPDCADLFVFSNGWFRGFLKRFQISYRRVTHASTRVPEEIIRCTNQFLQFIRRNSRMAESWMSIALLSDPVGGISLQRFPPHLIVNLDETPMPFEFLEGCSYDHKGAISVQGRSERSGWSKRQATLILTIVGDGSYVEQLKPVIIFHGKGTVMAKEGALYHTGVEVKFNETAYNNEVLFEEWINTRLASYTEGRETLLVMDVARFHKTPKIQAALQNHNITAALIPPGLTSYLQPLDVGFNGPFKKWLRDETDLYLDRLDDLGTTPERWTLRDRRIMVTHVVAKAWERAFTNENKAMVAGLFKKTGISIHPDGREDDLISIKGIDSDKICLEGWYLPPSLRKNHDISETLAGLDNNEYISTAEALGLLDQYSALTNEILKQRCRERGLPVGGRKEVLIRRLADDDAAKATQRQATGRESDQVDHGSDQADHQSDQADHESDQTRRESDQEGHQSDRSNSGSHGGNHDIAGPAEPVYAALGAATRAMSPNGIELDDDNDQAERSEVE